VRLRTDKKGNAGQAHGNEYENKPCRLLGVDIKSRQFIPHKERAIATFLALLLGSTALPADRILVFGDSGADPIVPALRAVLLENGHEVAVNLARPQRYYTARELSSPQGLDHISLSLDRFPEANIVHLCTGKNDWYYSWTSDMAGTQEEADMFTAILEDVETIVDHIFSIRPDAQIFWAGSYFSRPVNPAWGDYIGTPSETNAVHIAMDELAAQFAMTKHPNLTFGDFTGLLQVIYGFDGNQYTQYDPPFPIPPGDPSLPDPTLPSPSEPFIPGDPWHLTRDGNKVWAQAQYDLFYEPLLNGQDLQINAGHSGAWYNPVTSGQGQLIDVIPADQYMFLAWFTFTDAASNTPFEQHWYTAQGNYDGNQAELILYETLGGRFDDPQEVAINPVGEVAVSFSNCEQGQMVYSIDTDGRQGTIPLQRLIPGSGDVCEDQSGKAAITTEAVDINAGMDGAWVNNDTLGQGFLIDAHPNPDGGNFIFVAWFTYGDDTASGQRWLTAQGDFTGSTAAIDVYETTGGRFDDAQAVNVDPVGTMNLDFTDCSNAQLSYSLTDEDLAGDMELSRLIPGGQALCEELAGAD
jgi:hypothetical protein